MQTSSQITPEVSVVIPARNEEHFVGAALASVAAQTYPHARMEVIVVDNGSTDATAEVVRQFISTGPDLCVRLLHEPVAGVSRAKNCGVRQARGHWLVFLDADSSMAPDLIECVMSWVRRGYDAGCIRVLTDSPDRLDRAFFGLMEWGKTLFKLQAQMFYCTRELWTCLGGFAEDLRLAEDRDFLQRAQRAKVPMCQVNESWITTSPRRLRQLPFRLNMLVTFVRWTLANWGIGRHWRY